MNFSSGIEVVNNKEISSWYPLLYLKLVLL